MRDGIDEFTLLCEGCGYVIEGLARDGVCPECGRPIAESLPERRVGTPGIFDCLGQPGASFGRMAIDPLSRSTARAWARCWLAGGIVAGSAYVQWLMVTLPGSDAASIAELIVLPGVGAALAMFLIGAVLFVLTWIESAGLRFIGSRRGFRVSQAVAETVCSHAAAGWVAGAWVWAAGCVLVGLGATDLLVPIIGLGVAGLGAFGGLIAFEVLAYLGMRRCRFANRAREGTREPGA